jgi:uncharacterized protein
MPIITPDLIQAIRRQYRLPWNGFHGVAHWARVRENGLRLAQVTGGNPQVVELFALFHDACRLNEDYDPKHGSRGADLAFELHGKFFELPNRDFTALRVACRLHTEGLTDGDVTVQTCWDADRLDLGRVGIKPSPLYLCTDAAKNPAMLEWAYDRGCAGVQPEFVNQLMAADNVLK